MITKKEIYAKYGIEYDTKTQKILSPIGYVKPLLINGNAKIGKGVYHFSTLPTNQIFDVVINGRSYAIKGTCVCSCVGCYATKANYRYQSTKPYPCHVTFDPHPCHSCTMPFCALEP